MGGYEPWRAHLISQSADRVVMTFNDLATLVPTMPAPARTYAPWWSNEKADRATHVQCKSWLGAGFLAEVDIARGTVTFLRQTDW
jgi:hypothetical protein